MGDYSPLGRVALRPLRATTADAVACRSMPRPVRAGAGARAEAEVGARARDGAPAGTSRVRDCACPHPTGTRRHAAGLWVRCGIAGSLPTMSPLILHTHDLEGARARDRARDTALALALTLALALD